MAAILLTLLAPYWIYRYGGHDLEHAQSLCPFKMLTGLPCPGCGITKSMAFFYQGEYYKSISYHLFGPAVVVFSIGLFLLLAVELFSKKEIGARIFYNKPLSYTLAVVLGVYHLVRLCVFLSTNDLSAIMKESIWQ